MILRDLLRVLGSNDRRDGRNLTHEEAYRAFLTILDGEESEIRIGAFLIALRWKGVTVDEVTGFARAARERATIPCQGMEGLVCLGDLADSWYPALDFGDVLQTVVDIAGYRNYDLYQPATTEEGSPTLRANFFDYEAAVWAMGHQAEIEANGGRLIRPRVPAEVGYPNVVIALD